MGEKFPLMHNILAEEGKPFVASTDKNLQNRVIVRSITLKTEQHVLYIDYEMVNANPTEEEIFKTQLANPQPIEFVKACTAGVYRLHPKDS